MSPDDKAPDIRTAGNRFFTKVGPMLMVIVVILLLGTAFFVGCELRRAEILYYTKDVYYTK